jgi:hypothetical protein
MWVHLGRGLKMEPKYRFWHCELVNLPFRKLVRNAGYTMAFLVLALAGGFCFGGWS